MDIFQCEDMDLILGEVRITLLELCQLNGRSTWFLIHREHGPHNFKEGQVLTTLKQHSSVLHTLVTASPVFLGKVITW